MRKLLAHLNISTASRPSVIHAATVPMCTVRAGFSNGGLEQRKLALKGRSGSMSVRVLRVVPRGPGAASNR